jgi:metal-responsive CopG/Arc/MetJ family transcriptional regulator
MAQTSKMQTYQDAINALINESVILPQELLTQIQSFIEENKQLGFTTKEEFIRDAVRFRLSWLSQEREHVEVQKEEYDLLDEAVREMDTPYRSAEGFINAQIRDVLGKYEEWKRARKGR